MSSLLASIPIQHCAGRETVDASGWTLSGGKKHRAQPSETNTRTRTRTRYLCHDACSKMTSFKQPRKSRRSSLWQQYDAHEEDEYDETNGSPLLSRSSSTPYKLYTSRASAVGADEEGDETGSGSPFRRQQQQSTPRSSYSQVPHVPTAAFVQSHTPVRRKNASFGSPGMRASPSVQSMAAASGSPAPASGSLKKAGPRKARTSARFVRRKTFEQRSVFSLRCRDGHGLTDLEHSDTFPGSRSSHPIFSIEQSLWASPLRSTSQIPPSATR